MRTTCAVILPLLLITTTFTGCTRRGLKEKKPVLTIDQKRDRAVTAGKVAVAAYVTVHTPSKEEALAVKVVVDKVNETLVDYVDGGFTKTAPGIYEAIDKLIKKDRENTLAKSLADVLLSELDKVFERHPDWQTKGGVAAELVSCFCDGAGESLDRYITR
jgi:hypothetical protein